MGLILLSIISGIFFTIICVLFWWYILGDKKGWNWVATLEGGIIFGIISGIVLTFGLYYLAKFIQ